MELKMIIAEKSGKEIEELIEDIDMDIGKENDFEIIVPISKWDSEKFSYGNKIFIPGTEFGGIIECWNSLEKEVKVKGITWRGLLYKAVIEPPDNASNIILKGEINNCIKKLLGSHLGSLFHVDDKQGININTWEVERYTRLGEELDKLLKAHNQKLEIKYIQPKSIECGHIELSATPVKDLSKEIEYSKESKAKITVEDNKGGINHLICVGKGENEERTVVHLYTDQYGNIGEQHFFKEDERADIYEYTSAKLEKLKENGIKKLEELKNKKTVKIAEVKDLDCDIGDIISGYDQITNTTVQKPIQSKILKGANGNFKIEYKVEE